MATARHEEEMKRKAALAAVTTKDPLERLRAKCLARGANGIRSFAIQFKVIDDNKNRKLEYDEFKKALIEYGLGYTNDEMFELFKVFDKDNSGSIDFDEFLEKLRVCF
jgi:hypothetical protein